MVLPVIPGLLDDIFPAIVVMEQRGVKPDAVQLDRVAPRAPNILRGGQVVGHVFKNCPSAQESAGAQMPPEEGLPFMSSRVVVESGEGSRFQFFRSFDSCKRTPGNHSNVELAI